MRYITKAKKLLNAGFYIVGFGYFNITVEEVSQILEYLENNDFKSITELYQRLEKERL